jgi:hypothetical protein
MAEIPKWPGSGSVISGSTPFGFYDEDSTYQTQGPQVASWCAKRLGYPIVDVELQDLQFYACFEEAVTEYGAQVHQFNIRQNMMKLQGSPTSSNLNNTFIGGGEVNNLVTLAQDYGSEAGVGGNVEWNKGYITVGSGSQTYDLLSHPSSSLSGSASTLINDLSNVEIKKIYHNVDPAITRYYDPFALTGTGYRNLIDDFGFGSYSPAVNFVMYPIYEDLLRIQAIELNDAVRRSGFSFKLINNKLTVFPIPQTTFKIWFDYIEKDDRSNIGARSSGGVVSDYSNVPYNNLTYNEINDVGKQWIRKYTLATAKEVLGAIREKYSSVPIPGSEVSLDGAALRAEAVSEKEDLITQLRENLEETSRRRQMEIEEEISEKMNNQLGRIPIPIFIG